MAMDGVGLRGALWCRLQSCSWEDQVERGALHEGRESGERTLSGEEGNGEDNEFSLEAKLSSFLVFVLLLF